MHVRGVGWRPAFAAAAVALLLAGCFDRGERPAADAPGQQVAQCGAQAALVGIDHSSICLAYPASGASEVPVDTRLYLKFGRDIDPDTLTHESFSLTGPWGPVPGKVVYDAQRRDAFFEPAVPLDGEGLFTATLSAAVQHADQTPLEGYAWQFQTGAASPRFLYALNQFGGETISVYIVEPESGALRFHGYHPVEEANAVDKMSVAPDQATLFVVGTQQEDQTSVPYLWHYQVDPRSSRLTPSESPVALGSWPRTPFLVPPGREHAYTVYGAPAPAIQAFALGGAAPEPAHSFPLAIVSEADPALVADPRGRFLFLAGYTWDGSYNGHVVSYRIETDGSLAEGDSLALPLSRPSTAVLHPAGSPLLIGTYDGALYAIEVLADGSFGEVLADDLWPDNGVEALALNPQGNRLFVRHMNALTTWSVGPGGSVLPESTLNLPTSWPLDAYSMVIDPGGEFAIFTETTDGSTATDALAVITVDDTGGLETTAKVAGRTMPWALAMIRGRAPVRLRTDTAYSASIGAGGSDVRAFGVEQAGEVHTLLASPLPAGVELQPDADRALAIDPQGRTLYLAGGNPSDPESGAVAMFALDGAEAITELQVEGSHVLEKAFSSSFRVMAVEASGRFAYVTDDYVGGFHLYRIADDGHLSLVDSYYEIVGGVNRLLIHPTGRYLYAFAPDGQGWGEMYVATIDAADGTLDYFSSTWFPDGPFAVDASGRFVLVADAPDGWPDQVLAYPLESDGLPFTDITPGSVMIADLVPADAAVHPAGRYVYVLDSGAARGGDGVIHVLEFDPLAEVEGQSYPGELTARPDLLEAPSAGPLWSLHIDAAGQLLYVGTEGGGGVGEVLVYRIGEDGGLTYLDTLTQGARPQVVTRTRVE